MSYDHTLSVSVWPKADAGSRILARSGIVRIGMDLMWNYRGLEMQSTSSKRQGRVFVKQQPMKFLVTMQGLVKGQAPADT